MGCFLMARLTLPRHAPCKAAGTGSAGQMITKTLCVVRVVVEPINF